MAKSVEMSPLNHLMATGDTQDWVPSGGQIQSGI